mgnify:CR=1 FL=1
MAYAILYRKWYRDKFKKVEEDAARKKEARKKERLKRWPRTRTYHQKVEGFTRKEWAQVWGCSYEAARAKILRRNRAGVCVATGEPFPAALQLAFRKDSTCLN